MTALPRCIRPLTGHRIVTLMIVMALLAGVFPAGAQSPVAQPDIKLIHLYEQTCPVGIDPSAGSLSDAVNACPQSIPNVAFTLTSQNPSFAPQTHPTNASSDTEWHEIPSGVPYSIQQTVPAGYSDPLVRCQFGMHFDPSIPNTELTFPAPGGRLDIGTGDPTLTGYGDVSCYWFDRPSQPSGVNTDAAAPQAQEADAGDQTAAIESSPEVIAAQTGGTRLDIRAWQCPFHYDAAVATVDELLANCTRPHRDANFIINGDPATQQYTGDIGATSYQNVPFGTVTIRQLAYASFDPVRVFCYTQPYTASHGPLQASQEIAFTEEPGDTFSVSITVNPGDAIDCIWFDSWITEDDLGTVLLHKYVCPDGTATSGLSLEQMLQTCPEPQKAYFRMGPSTGNETDDSGYLGFINFSPGTYLVQETAPLGYAPARIFCRSYNADDWNHVADPYIEQTITQKTGVNLQVQAHWETECQWFNVKGVNYGYLDIAAFGCPLNFTPTATTPRGTFAQQCQTGLSGATFDIESFPNFSLAATSTDGYATFQEHIPVGGMTISSTPPQTYQLVNVFCGDAPFIGIGAIPTNWKPFSNGFVQYQVPIDYQIVCEFYYKPIAIVDASAASPVATDSDEAGSSAAGTDSGAVEASPVAAPAEASPNEASDQSGTVVGTQGPSGGASGTSQPPVDANAPAALTLVAFTCPPGYDLYAGDAVPSGDCPDPAIGIDFTLTGPDGTAQTAPSNAGGELGWMELMPGAYLLQAALPPELSGAFIADCVSNQRSFSTANPLTPFAFAGPEGQIGITLLPGETLGCTWYDIPAALGGMVSATLLRCPGTTVVPAQCTPVSGPATLHFEPVSSDGATFDLQIGDDGAGQATASGVFRLTEFPPGTCLIDSDDFDANGQLTVQDGDAVEIRVYTCGG